MRFGYRVVVFGLVGSLLAGLLLGLPPAAVVAAAPDVDQSSVRPVPVWPVAARAEQTPQMPAWRGSVPVWPVAGSQVVTPGVAVSGVDSVASGQGAPGGLPVTVRAMGGSGSSVLSEPDEQRMLRGLVVAPVTTSVRVEVQDRGFARRAGVSGVVLAVSPVAAVARPAEVQVSVDFSGFRSAFGGDWASRLRLVRLPACALSTPEVADCQVQTPIAGSRLEPATSRVSAPVRLGAVGAESWSSSLDKASGAGVVLALTAGGSSDNGTWEATSLNPTTTWAAGSSGGDFTYAVPLTVPQVPGGLMPADSVTTLRYSSGSVDGLTKSTSTQASWVGEGFADTTPGFVERSYKSCADDGRPASNGGDWCWSGYNPIMVVLGGRSTRILWDAVTGWKTEDDSAGWKVEPLTGAANGVHLGEHWKITTGDGTQYFFGSRPRGTTAVDNGGTLRAVVYSNNAGEPCYNPTFAYGQCWMGYRWNLDYVLDRHGNTITYRWGFFSNKYGANNNTTAIEYDAYSALGVVEYGANTVAGAGPSARIEYTSAYRCFYSQPECDTPGNDWMWPDSPRDKLCAVWLTSCPDNKSQTFFSLFRLAKVTTRVWDAGVAPSGAWSAPIDEVTLTHEFPATGDFIPPAGDDSSPSLFLRFVDRTGWPQMRFDAIGKHNRVHWSASNGLAPMNHYRVNLITTGLGEQIAVDYSNPDCTSSSFPGGQADNNTRLCFPQYLSIGNDTGWSWFHKYRTDGVWSHDLTGGGPSEHWAYGYNTVSSNSAVLWAFDQNVLQSNMSLRSWSRWVGYSNVITVHGTMGGPIQTSENLYYRGLHGDRTSAGGWNARNVTIQDWDPAHPDVPALAGTLRNTVTFDGFKATDGSNWKTAVIHKQTVTPTGSQALPNSNPAIQANRVREHSTVTANVASAAAGGTRWTEIANTYDSYGRKTVVKDWGDPTPNDDRCTNTTWTQNTSLWLIDFPTETITTNCWTNPGAPGTLAGSRIFYDGSTSLGVIGARGLPTTTHALADVNGSTRIWQQAGRATFDAYGRTLDAFDALDRKTTTAYTPATGRPTSVATKVYPAVGTTWTATTHLSLLRGQPVKIVDYNGKVSLAEYDANGRLTSVWLNHRATALPTAVTPDKWFGYWLRGNGPNLVHTKVLGPDGQQLQSYQLFDGRMRPRQTHAPSADGTGRVFTDTTYNTIGKVDKISTFDNDTGFDGFTGALVGFGDATIAVQQRYSYDNLGRPTVTAPWTLGAARGAAWNTTVAYDGDREIKTTPPAGGTATTTVHDARGNTTALRQHQGGTPAGTATTTSYTYDRLDQLIRAVDPAGNEWTYAYDRLGQRRQTVDPDAGTSSIGYDVAGQVTSTADGRGQQLFYTYDLLGRRTTQRADNPNGLVTADWTYDTALNGLGQLGSTRRHYFNGTATEIYKAETTSYDNAYRPLSTTHTIPGFGPGGGDLTYTVGASYKPNGALATMTLPGVGSLPGETLTHTYTAEGLPDRITTDQSQGIYVNDTMYHPDGLTHRLFLGNPGKQIRLSSDFDPANRRLTKQWISTEKPAVPGDFFVPHDYTYGYDPAGNVKSIAGNVHGVAEQEECFTYDHLRRLRVAWTQTSGVCNDANPQRGGTVEPYWRTWDFDDIGNRLEQKDINPTGGNTTWTSTNGSAGAVKPHQVKTITATGPLAGTPTRTFSYDPAGNTLTRTSPTGTAQTLTWDKEGHLGTLNDGGVTTTYIYDTAGSRLIARKPGKEILYLPDGTELEKTSGGLLGTRHYGFAVRDIGGLKWVAANHQGTTTIQLDPNTLAATRRLFMPYGEPRGTQPPAWLGSKGYVGGTKDDTGLTHLGAREYDPTLGRFVSVDPIMDPADPQQWHPYTYANASPVSNSDPSGLKNCTDNDCSGGGSGSGQGIGDIKTLAEDEMWGWVVQHTVGVGTTINGVLVPTGGPSSDEIVKQLKETCAQSPGLCELAFYCPSNNPGECGESWAKGVKGLMKSMFGNEYGLDYDKKLFGDWRDQIAENLVDFGLALGGTVLLLRGTGGKTGNWWNRNKGLGACSNSFDPTTLVLLADGTTKQINEIDVGDLVLATDPETGETGARKVAGLIVGNGQKALVKLTIVTHDGEYEIIATTNHPFWIPAENAWLEAGELAPGASLQTTAGDQALVKSITRYSLETSVNNLTVEGLHTYYVLAGNTPVLVHNDDDQVMLRGVLPGEEVSFAARPNDFKVDKTTGYVIPGKGPSLNTSQDALAKYGRTGVPVDMRSIPDGLEVIHTSGTHYEIVVKEGVNMTADEFQAKLSSIRTCG